MNRKERAMSKTVIHTEGLTKIYKGDLGQKPVVGIDSLNLDVLEGEVFAFLGPNGAGKTTTIKLLTRLLFPSQGTVHIMGMPLSSRESMRQVGYLPEQPNLYGYLTGVEFLDFMGRIFDLPARARKKRIPEVLGLVGLSDCGTRAIRTYSRGMMQRLGMAQALINDPELLILDEPMSALDPIGRKDFRDLILSLKKRGKTLFFSSHILSDAELVADRIGILKKGRMTQTGRLEDLMGTRSGIIEVTFIPNRGKPAKSALRKYDFDVQGRKVLVRLEDEEDLPGLIRSVTRAGAKLVSVIPQRQSLEDIFMAEIGR
jgi:ABC-2 type transport system ATP-binding protein